MWAGSGSTLVRSLKSRLVASYYSILVLVLSTIVRVFCVVYILPSSCRYVLLFLELDVTTAFQLATVGC